MELLANAKINLTLDILRRREDGYHDLQMAMQAVTLADQLTAVPAQGEEGQALSDLHFLPTGGKNLAQIAAAFRQAVTLADQLTAVPAQGEEGQALSDLHFLPTGGKNLAQIAAAAFRQATGLGGEVDVSIQKHIPVCAGLAGGSADAAAMLRAMNLLFGAGLSPVELAKIGERVGSDVPFCVLGGTALAEGRGELLTPLPRLPDCQIIICKPPFSISTPQLFGRVNVRKIVRRPDTAGIIAALEAGDLAGVARRMYNVFEDVLEPRRAAEINEIKAALIDCGALGASMSGSGPSVFGLFDSLDSAQAAQARLKETYRDVFLCAPASPNP